MKREGETFGKRRNIAWVGPSIVMITAIGSPLVSHLALVIGHAHGIAMLLAAAQSVAGGVLLWKALPRHRWLGPAATTVLLAALALGTRQSPETGLMAAAGTSHAILYTALLIGFAATLRPGRTSLATTLASRLNPHFHPGMIPYTRAVTVAWCIFFALQLALSAVLLATNPALWRSFVTTLHAPLVLAMALLEFLVRRWRWRHQHYTSLADTFRGIRGLAHRPASSDTIR